MMRRFAPVIFLIVTVFCIFMLFHYVRKAGASQKKNEKNITYDGIPRRYIIHIPGNYDKSSSYPLVLALHGGGGRAENMDKLTGFNELSDKEGFIVVYPDGVEKHWNDGRGVQQYRSHREKIDDVGFLCALVDEISKKYSIDQKRVYSTGISNGGLMSFRLACEAPDKFAAVACVTAQLSEDLLAIAKPAKSISVLVMNGTLDPLVPYNGGDINFLEIRKLGKVISTDDTIRFWVKHNHCSKAPVETAEPDKEPGDGTTVKKCVYGGGDEGAEVVLYKIEGGGHTWPGGWQYLSEKLIGRTSRDIDATSKIWSFFKAHRRR